LWILPKADHLSIGIGALNPKPGDLQTVLERVVQRYGISLQSQERHGHTLPIYSQPELIGTRRCLLAGDAAGLVDPFTGEGIRFVIKSGRLAAEAILAGQPESYTASVDRTIGRNHRLGNGMNNVFYRFTRPSFELALRNPAVSQALMGLFGDRIGYTELLLTIAGTLPLAMLTKKMKLEKFLNQ
jgi:flavin-dependent dehydrogenase